LLERAGVQDIGRLSEKNLSDLWLDWASSQDTLRPMRRPRLYPATPGLIVRSDSASFPVNINTASAELLEKLPGVGPKTAERIIEYRTEHGRFSAVEELLDVKGIGPKKMEKIRPLATVR
jgi:competence protein ComEA